MFLHYYYYLRLFAINDTPHYLHRSEKTVYILRTAI